MKKYINSVFILICSILFYNDKETKLILKNYRITHTRPIHYFHYLWYTYYLSILYKIHKEKQSYNPFLLLLNCAGFYKNKYYTHIGLPLITYYLFKQNDKVSLAMKNFIEVNLIFNISSLVKDNRLASMLGNGLLTTRYLMDKRSYKEKYVYNIALVSILSKIVSTQMFLSKPFSPIVKIYSTGSAFAAVNEKGHVFSWGVSSYGGDSSSVSASLTNITEIYSTDFAFAAVNDKRQVITWGWDYYGGD